MCVGETRFRGVVVRWGEMDGRACSEQLALHGAALLSQQLMPGATLTATLAGSCLPLPGILQIQKPLPCPLFSEICLVNWRATIENTYVLAHVEINYRCQHYWIGEVRVQIYTQGSGKNLELWTENSITRRGGKRSWELLTVFPQK